MRNITSAFIRALAEDKRDYQNRLVITLTDNSVITVDNTGMWENGFHIEDSVSADNVFQIGAAIINQGTFVINNIYGGYDAYSFEGAKVVAYTGLVGLDDGSDEEIKIGTFIVDEAMYNGSLITLKCFDNMSKFDRAYTTNLTYPATLYDIVLDACRCCGVPLDNSSYQFPHRSYIVTNKPSDENTTFRQVISWAAQIACCFARCNSNGNLELKWFETDLLDSIQNWIDGGMFDSGTPYYESGDNADGGSFNPWDSGDEYDGGSFTDRNAFHIIYSSYSSSISTDDVVITGVKVVKKIKEESSETIIEYTSGTTGYVVSIENNDFIDGDHGQDVADWIGTAINGIHFRNGEITHPNNPSIEAGDVAAYIDRHENIYPILISSTTFSPDNSQRTMSSAETPRKNSAQRFTESTRNYVELRKRIKEQQSTFEEATDALSRRIAASGGLYCTKVTASGATKTYYHNKPNLNESDIRMLFSDVGFTLTSDGGQTWYGMTVDGTMITAILQAVGINAEWITAGTLTVGGLNNTRGLIEILDANNVLSGIITNYGVISKGVFISYYSSNGYATKTQNGRTYYHYGGSGQNYDINTLYNMPWGDAYGCISSAIFSNDNKKGLSILSAQDFVLIGKHTAENTSSSVLVINVSGDTILGYSEKVIIRECGLRLTNGNINSTVGSINLNNGNLNITKGSIHTGKGSIDTDDGGIHSLNGNISVKNPNTTSNYDFRIYFSSDTDYSQYAYIGYAENSNMFVMTNTVNSGNGLYVGSLNVTGTKNRVVETEHYGSVGMNAFETASSHFADIGSGMIGEDGIVTIFFDPVFAETIDMHSEYQVFITRTSEKETYWVEKRNGYFIVYGESGATFDWMITGYQRDYVTNRMEQIDPPGKDINNEPLYEEDRTAVDKVENYYDMNESDSIAASRVEEMVNKFNEELEGVLL